MDQHRGFCTFQFLYWFASLYRSTYLHFICRCVHCTVYTQPCLTYLQVRAGARALMAEVGQGPVSLSREVPGFVLNRMQVERAFDRDFLRYNFLQIMLLSLVLWTNKNNKTISPVCSAQRVLAPCEGRSCLCSGSRRCHEGGQNIFIVKHTIVMFRKFVNS